MQKLFEQMKTSGKKNFYIQLIDLDVKPTTSIFNAMIDGLLRQDKVVEVENLRREMKLMEIEPDASTVNIYIGYYGLR